VVGLHGAIGVCWILVNDTDILDITKVVGYGEGCVVGNG
jgi:hypothetical protein